MRTISRGPFASMEGVLCAITKITQTSGMSTRNHSVAEKNQKWEGLVRVGGWEGWEDTPSPPLHAIIPKFDVLNLIFVPYFFCLYFSLPKNFKSFFPIIVIHKYSSMIKSTLGCRQSDKYEIKNLPKNCGFSKRSKKCGQKKRPQNICATIGQM